MKRFLPVAVIVALAGAAAVVVISGGDGERPEQPSVEQPVSPADELPAGLRELLGRLGGLHSVGCGAGRRAPFDFNWSLGRSPTASCRVRVRGRPDIVAAKVRGKWTVIVRHRDGLGGAMKFAPGRG